jgi:hypothetical protein
MPCATNIIECRQQNIFMTYKIIRILCNDFGRGEVAI